MIRLVFIACLWLTLSPTQAQQVLLDQPVRAGEVTFFPDIKDPNVYYYLSDKASLAYREDGTPEFSFFRYVEGDKTKNSSVQTIREGTGGGILHMIIELGVPEDILGDGKAALKAINPAAMVKGPAVYDSGKFALISSFVAGDGKLSSQVVGVGAAPILDGHKAAVSIQLTKQGAKILWETFKTPTPDMSFTFEMTLSGYLSPIEAKLEADFNQIYKHKAFDVGLATPIIQAEVQGAFTDMIKNGAIKVTGAEADEKMDRLIEMTMKKLTDMMMEPITQSSNSMDKLMQKQSSLQRASQMLNQNRFGPYRPVPYGGYNSYGGGYGQQVGYGQQQGGYYNNPQYGNRGVYNDQQVPQNAATNNSSSAATPSNANTATPSTSNSSTLDEDAVKRIRNKPLPETPTTNSSASKPPNKPLPEPPTANSSTSKPPNKPLPEPPTTTRSRSNADAASKPPVTTRPRSGAVTANSGGAASKPVQSTAAKPNTTNTSSTNAKATTSGNKATRKTSGRTPSTRGAVGISKPIPPISIAASFRMKEVKMGGKFTVSFNKMMKDSKTFSFAENIGNVKCKSCFHEINLDEIMFFKQRDIRAFMDGLNSKDFENYINYVTVMLHKPHQNGKVTAQEIVIDRSRFNDKGNNFTLSYGVNGDDNYDDWLKYEYEIQWNFFGDNTVKEARVPTYFNGITLSPPYKRRTVQLEADPTYLKDAGVRLATVKLYYQLGGKEYTKVETLNPSSGIFTIPVDYISPGESYKYDYEITWRLRGGKTVESGRKTSESSVLFVDELPED